MEINMINPYIVKIIVSIKPRDSINAISKRIGLSYGWTYKWIKALEEADMVKLTRMNVYLQERSQVYIKFNEFIQSVLSKKIQFHYEVLSLFGISYCFTKSDAVFVWTKGGYNIGRYKHYYPIFIKVDAKERLLFEWYCKKLGLSTRKKKGIFYVVDYDDSLKKEFYEGIPVDSLSETIQFMKENQYNFQPALEMIQEMHQKRLGIKYKEVITNA
ncbi:hypothetical protein HYY69_00105 [Candidatus Woesearchaeota archaeon]|nr:hypothetical protein [Candidatus Woesearchaeota archaeon]